MKNPKKVDSLPWFSLISLFLSSGYVGAICFTESTWMYAGSLLIMISMIRFVIVAPLEIRGLTQAALSWLLANGAGRALIGFSGSVLIPALFLSRLIREFNLLIKVVLLGWGIILTIAALWSLTQLSLHYQDQSRKIDRFLILSGLTIAAMSVFPILRLLYCWGTRCDLDYVVF